jgi:hypothetical protein
MLEGDEVLRGRLMRSQTLIVLESMSSVRLIPAIRSLGAGGWDSDDRSVLISWSEVTALPSMMRQAAEAMGSSGIEPKRMSTGLARKSAMLSRKMTSLVEAIDLHKEP